MSDDCKRSISYAEFVNKLLIEFGDFMQVVQSGRTNRHAAVLARSKSVKLRNSLKEFRQISLANDKRINEIFAEAKKRIDENDDMLTY